MNVVQKLLSQGAGACYLVTGVVGGMINTSMNIDKLKKIINDKILVL